MRARLLPIASLVVVALATSLALSSIALATYDPLGSGRTELRLSGSFLEQLRKGGVKVRAVRPAELRGATVTFPVAGGKLDPTTANGIVEHEGALVFEAAGKDVPVRALRLKTASRGMPLSAKVGGSQLKLARAANLVVSRQGFGEKIRVASLAMAPKLATRLGKKLGRRDVFEPGMAIGEVVTSIRPQTVRLRAEGSAELSLAPDFAAKLASLFVAVNPIFPAEHVGAGFTLPVFSGDLAPGAPQGAVDTTGALEFLQLGGGQAFWRESRVDLTARTVTAEVEIQPAPPFGGKLGRLPIAALLGGTVGANERTRKISLREFELRLSAPTAQNFNEIFAEPQGKRNVFLAGEPLGMVSVEAQGQ